ncbi:unnamed protein product [Alternaria alternata]
MAQTLRLDEYTVGWVCALPIERAAAEVLLDETYATPPAVAFRNMYICGRIGKHNVVIGCLPSGNIGISAATGVVMQMKADFKETQFCLLVGIAGGVPNDLVDIRLGDVVVSNPEGEHVGVVQYDLGKETLEGYKRTGYLNAPPASLLFALNSMKTDGILEKGKMLEYISRLGVERPIFARQTAGPDVLFAGDYEHVAGSRCDGCDPARLIKRDERKQVTHVHYGTIASGNKVIKKAKERDRISKLLGGVLCFEMEAAGLMNSMPCLVIRGICDYADSHKNDKWQPYAAAAAAAYAKDLLMVVEPKLKKYKQAREIAHGTIKRPMFFPQSFSDDFANREFFGREDIVREIDTCFTKSKSRCVGIYGLSGMGKSHMAYHYVTQSVRKDISKVGDGCLSKQVFWIDAGNPSAIASSYQRIAECIDTFPELDSQTALSESIKNWLEDPANGPWILVIDGLDSQEVAKEHFKSLPSYNKGQILITTTNRGLLANPLKLHRGHCINLSELSVSDTQSMFMSLTSLEVKDLDDNELLRISRLPKLIEMMAQHHNEYQVSIGSMLDGNSNRQIDTLVDKIMSKALDTFFNSGEDDFKQAGELALTLSCLSKDRVDRELLKKKYSPEKHEQISTWIGILENHSFVQGKLFLTMHEIAQSAIYRWLERVHGQEEILYVYNDALCVVYNDYQDVSIGEASGYLRKLRYMPHVEVFLTYIKTQEKQMHGDSMEQQHKIQTFWFRAGALNSIVTFSRVYVSGNRYEDAIELLEFARVYSYRAEDDRCTVENVLLLRELASVYENRPSGRRTQEFLNKALDALQGGANIAKKIDEQNQVWRILLAESRILRKLGRPEDAKKILQNLEAFPISSSGEEELKMALQKSMEEAWIDYDLGCKRKERRLITKALKGWRAVERSSSEWKRKPINPTIHSMIRESQSSRAIAYLRIPSPNAWKRAEDIFASHLNELRLEKAAAGEYQAAKERIWIQERNLAAVWLRTGRLSEATEKYHYLLEAFEKRHGRHDQETRECAYSLRDAYELQDRVADAKVLEEKFLMKPRVRQIHSLGHWYNDSKGASEDTLWELD